MTIQIYGIPNCDTVKKARKWLEANGIAFEFHDYKKEGADNQKVARWIEEKGVDTVLNRRGTTWRKLTEAEKAQAETADGAVELLVQHPSMIKRPVAEHPGGILVGFKEETWAASLS
ncbi:ArsC family reductase [Qipengyuania nanhaisediminis]|uniref:ArsC family reductase n=1 Tax=Qipengyuania nanhaisediminis TaxID=604088 RepID=UPI0038B35FA5